MANDLVKCPNCAESIKGDAIVCRFCQRGLSPKHFKKCPFCAEMVRHAAQKCRYCQSSLSEPPQGRPGAGSRVPRPSPGPLKSTEVALALPESQDET